MTKIKELYSSPNTTVLVVRFEDRILGASDFRSGGAGTYGDDEINNNDEY